MTTFSKLLEEMVVQVLTRLPAKSLIRFRCVNKLWFTLINNPNFVTKNLSCSTNNKYASSTCILFKRTLLKDRTITDEKEMVEVFKNGDYEIIDVLISLLYIRSCDGDDNNLSFVVEDFDVPFPLNASANIVEISAIKEYRLLPKSCLLYDIPPQKEDDIDALEADTNAVGFGFDYINKVYKVVRVVEFVTGTFTHFPTRVEAYTLGDSAWREISSDNVSHVSWIPNFHLHIKGFYYWWGSRGPEEEVIQMFDMSNEVFHYLLLPVPFREGDALNRSLAAWKGTVAFFAYKLDNEAPKSFQIWLMEDFPGANSLWTKQMTIGPLEGVAIPLVFWNNDELTMVATNGRIVSCNLKTETLRPLPMNGVEDSECIQAACYVDSIVSVKLGKELESPDDNVGRKGYIFTSDKD